MTNPPPRKRFQIHLSTAIVTMFVAGALIWANIIPQKRSGRLGEADWYIEIWYGRPFECVVRVVLRKFERGDAFGFEFRGVFGARGEGEKIGQGD